MAKMFRIVLCGATFGLVIATFGLIALSVLPPEGAVTPKLRWQIVLAIGLISALCGAIMCWRDLKLAQGLSGNSP